ncbi:MAG: DUF3047 domain-containing protein [Syntrophaceae bacterium]
MKNFPPIIFFLLLFIVFIPLIGCNKADDSKKPEISAAAPAATASPGNSLASPSPEKRELSASPSVNVTSAPSTAPPIVTPAPSTEAPAVSPVSPVIQGKQTKKEMILVAGFDSAQMNEGVPAGWALDRRKGTPFIKLEKGADIYSLHMRSDSESSFGVKKGIKVDIKEYPYLNWKWKVTRLPDGGDVRKTNTDDQAIQFYVAFTPTGFPAVLKTPVLGYIWDNEAPKGWTGRSAQTGGGKLKYIVVRNKTDQLEQWCTEKRNIYEDYKKLIKDVTGSESPVMTHGVQFHINAQNTASGAESYICEVYFSKD